MLTKRYNFIKLILSVIICQAVGIVGSFFTRKSVGTWYAALKKPFFNPPNWIFGPVWIALYLMMGIALFLIWKDVFEEKETKKSFSLFFAQLFLNGLWSFVFFGLHSTVAGLFVITLLLIFIVLTIIQFKRLSLAAYLLLIPYVLWVGFAMCLNAAIVFLNI